MGSSQKFRLPSSLRREKTRHQPQSRPQDRLSDGKDSKAQHILGLTETALNTARNESISSSTTTRLPRLSFSDATTEFGSATAPLESPERTQDLQLKASSVLLHEEYHITANRANSIRSSRLRPSGSSSTLNSHYDPQKSPLSISQQTSESSRRDFALRKGSPIVVRSTTSDKDSLPQLRLFRSSKSRDKSEAKKLSKQGPRPPVSSPNPLPTGQHSSTPAAQGAPVSLPQYSVSPRSPMHSVDAHLQSTSPRSLGKSGTLPASTSSKANQNETPHVKVNIRRPKVGLKHWFDGLEGDSSEDESIHEPALQPSFVTGIQTAFEDGKIGSFSQSTSSQDPLPDPAHQGCGSHASTTSNTGFRPFPHSAPIPSRISTLNAKSSKSTLRRDASSPPCLNPPKPKPSSLASRDLHETSVLDLSSSDDEDSQPAVVESTQGSLPQLRDSIAAESLAESEIEIGTAQAIDTKQTSMVQATPSVRRVHNSQLKRHGRPSIRHNKIPDQRSMYFSDQSSEPAWEDNDLLTSFPATPTDTPGSRRASVQSSSCRSEHASIESRRLVSVTRQEESLLAAIRLRRLTATQSRGSSASRRIQGSRDPDQVIKQQRQPEMGSLGAELTALPRIGKGDVTPSISSANFDRASCTTFQTGISNDPSLRYSFASFKTDTSLDPETEFSMSLGLGSPVLLIPSRGINRLSRVTFFSTSTGDSRDGSCSRRESGPISTLEKLQAVPKREEITSQEFIDFPYRGWEARSDLAAH
ncbi:hypothetical protein ABEF92_006655 [Exophiala dermatitidis]|uniref:Uncharacterized protein n=1 Tax=Exophiala dermatitidis (strain ATCC 34100 / CBS 525.76 / NIH/UT8656) TaxID=858893 RepID=H6C828_EXODN|nr:uncharacterized protein HMPREF1120_08223 [Exophiala dermatitidis NIH/UT8656]EHY60255.1 hypothetical protein HMPREF1120_08223 [Exophiala dermatitidis NIH/UT8656]